MSDRILKNKPLVEAILEVKWALNAPAPNVSLDPHYKLLMGRMFDRLSERYPTHEQLPTAMMPDEIAAYLPQHRFRTGPEQWPLIQLGPGVHAD